MNPLIRLRGLITRDLARATARKIVTIVQVNSDGTSLADDLNGGRFSVAGDSVSAGKRALVEGGKIVAEVPALPTASFYV